MKRATEIFGWQEPASPNPNAGQGSVKIGRGIAYARYKQAENFLPLLGAGEASRVTVAAALANAGFDATGAKLGVAPFTPQRVKAALG